jgi:HNH endonuclease
MGRGGDPLPDDPMTGERSAATCAAPACARAAYSRELCEPHYRRQLRTGDARPHVPVGETPVVPCAADGCARAGIERGHCHAHYLRLIRHGDVDAARPLGRQPGRVCTVDGCGRRAYAKELCRPHYQRLKKTGTIAAAKPIRQVSGSGYVHHGYRVVPVPPELRHLTNGEASALEHRLVMARHLGRALGGDVSVHHLNGNRLDNRIDNLELWTRWQPSGQRLTDRIRDALDLIERYVPELLAGWRDPTVNND